MNYFRLYVYGQSKTNTTREMSVSTNELLLTLNEDTERRGLNG